MITFQSVIASCAKQVPLVAIRANAARLGRPSAFWIRVMVLLGVPLRSGCHGSATIGMLVEQRALAIADSQQCDAGPRSVPSGRENRGTSCAEPGMRRARRPRHGRHDRVPPLGAITGRHRRAIRSATIGPGGKGTLERSSARRSSDRLRLRWQPRSLLLAFLLLGRLLARLLVLLLLLLLANDLDETARQDLDSVLLAILFEEQLEAVLLDHLGANQLGARMLLGERRAHRCRQARFCNLTLGCDQLTALGDVHRRDTVLALDHDLVRRDLVLGLLLDLRAGQVPQHALRSRRDRRRASLRVLEARDADDSREAERGEQGLRQQVWHVSLLLVGLRLDTSAAHMHTHPT